jgi:hypothetical protein
MPVPLQPPRQKVTLRTKTADRARVAWRGMRTRLVFSAGAAVFCRFGKANIILERPSSIHVNDINQNSADRKSEFNRWFALFLYTGARDLIRACGFGRTHR